MSRDANGNFNLPAGNPVVTGTVITTAWANPTMADLGSALTDSLSRTGKGGMGAALNMGGFKISALAAGMLATDVPQATQVRDSTFILLNPCTSDSTGNNYSGVGVINTPPINGTLYMFLADKANTGPMTMSVNGAAALPIQIHGAAVSPGIVLTGAVIMIAYQNLTWRLANTAGVVGTINSVQSDQPNMISVTNNTVDAVATLNLHAGVANGLCQLDGSIKVPIAQLPFTNLFFVGNWNAAPGLNPANGTAAGQFYVIVTAGNLTIFRVSVGNTYTAQVTACAVGDQIVWNTAGTVAQPVGWYYVPASVAPLPAALVTVVATPTFPTATNAQAWFNQADPAIVAKLPLAGGTMSGAILQPAAPASAQALANKQYVDDMVAGVPAAVNSFNTRTGAVVLLSADVTAALAYTPANAAGQTFTGAVVATQFTTTGFNTSKGYSQTALVTAAPAIIDYVNGQSQILTLAAPLTVTAVNSIPVGSILRVVLVNTNFLVTWPASVHWPLGSAPDLGAGPLKKAIVVFENDGTVLLASGTAY